MRTSVSQGKIKKVEGRKEAIYNLIKEEKISLLQACAAATSGVVSHSVISLPKRYFRVSHFTSMDAFIKILQSGVFRFYDTKFMNDAEDYVYGRKLVLEVFEEQKNKLKKYAKDIDLVEALIGFHLDSADMNFSSTYALCLTRNEDDLTQWMAYSGKTGVELVFGFKSLSNFLSHVPSPRATGAMVYSLQRQKSLAIELVESAVGLVNILDHKELGVDEVDLHLSIEDFISFFTWRLKAPHFKRENEVRFIHVANSAWHSNKEYCYEAKGAYVRSYWAPDKETVQGKLPLLEVRVAPGGNEKARIASIKAFLKSEDYEHVSVVRSQIPLRYFE